MGTLLDEHGFQGLYDFVYVPIDFRSASAFGYVFINLVSTTDAQAFRDCFNNFSSWSLSSKKVAEVTWSRPVQGCVNLVERYRNSSLMHDEVPDEYKPAIFRNGKRVPFPSPTRILQVPEEMACRIPADEWWMTKMDRGIQTTL